MAVLQIYCSEDFKKFIKQQSKELNISISSEMISGYLYKNRIGWDSYVRENEVKIKKKIDNLI